MGADAAGWLYHGMAGRLCLDMGLNMDPAGFEETNMMSHREIQLRRQIYWTLYCHDKWASSYTGRICSMLVRLSRLLISKHADLYRIRKELLKCPMVTTYLIRTVRAERHSDHCKEL